MTKLQVFDSNTPRWLSILYLIADDMRYDIDQNLIDRLWVPKLKLYRDEIVCEALENGRWKVFPNINEVLEEIEVIEERHKDAAANREWERYQAEQKRAEEQGLLATDEDYAEMNRALKRLGMSKPEPAPIVQDAKAYTPPPPEELNRRRQEQLRAVWEKYGKQK